MPDNDLLLWDKVKLGDTEAFGLLFRKYYPMLCLFSRRFTNDLQTAREVVQDLFILLWEQQNDIKIKTSFKSYILRAVKYNSIRRVENERRRGIRIDHIPENMEDGAFYDHLEYAELQMIILEAIASLPDQCKKVFTLHRFHQLKYSEIALTLDISVKTVETHISKALRLIQNYLDKKFLIILVILFFFLL
jgi:RNA polymerase sigma-70 factor, ECF subfamily